MIALTGLKGQEWQAGIGCMQWSTSHWRRRALQWRFITWSDQGRRGVGSHGVWSGRDSSRSIDHQYIQATASTVSVHSEHEPNARTGYGRSSAWVHRK